MTSQQPYLQKSGFHDRITNEELLNRIREKITFWKNLGKRRAHKKSQDIVARIVNSALRFTSQGGEHNPADIPSRI